VAGAINGTAPGVRQFLGIPFAQQPLGDLRWMPPMPINQSASIIDATQFSPSCPQYEGASLSAYNQDVRELLINGPTGENCLTLSIWAPAYPTGKSLPVYIWIYGGGFQTGGSSVPYQNPAQWVQRTQSHIVVSIQYRLNIFGFPNAAGLASQNLGFLDQRLAIEWIQSNIASFGGNPSKMVMWGQSAGAQSVDIQNFAYPDDPIVSGFVCDSGSVYLNSLYSEDVGHTNFSSVASHFNCSGDAAAELSCMRSISSMDIEAYLKSYSDSGTTPSLAFDPFPDETIVFSNYTEQYLSGHLSTAPAIFGTNLNEGTSPQPEPSENVPSNPSMNSPPQTTTPLNYKPPGLNFKNSPPEPLHHRDMNYHPTRPPYGPEILQSLRGEEVRIRRIRVRLMNCRDLLLRLWEVVEKEWRYP